MNEQTFIHSAEGDDMAYRVAFLIAGYIGGTLTASEHEELDNWVTASMDNQRLFEDLTDPENLDEWKEWKDRLPADRILQQVKTRLTFANPTLRRNTRRKWTYAAAACTAGILAMVFLLIARRENSPTVPVAGKDRVVVVDIPPGRNKAMLTLADGTTKVLDQAREGVLATQQGVAVVKDDSGGISYEKSGVSPKAAVVYNILRVPRGGQYRLSLPDGTRVWLNAESYLRYPARFTGQNRRVELRGEGYFEVAPDPVHPFVVTADSVSVQVLGTKLNIDAYPEKKDIRVTLARGAVRVVSPAARPRLLKPGEQAAVSRTGSEIDVEPANLATVLAWKDGLFTFQDAPMQDVLGQISRWYDVDILNQTSRPVHFNASISRNVPASQLLHLLEQTDQVHFRIEPGKIIVTN